VSYEDAFEAFRDGDFRLAVPLLESAARETAYSSDAINHAYTLALYRSGLKNRLADAAFEIGDLHLERNPAVALDYFQRALWGGLDAACVRFIGEVFEGWAASRPPQFKLSKPLKRVAHVLGCVTPDHAPARHVSLLIRSLREHGVESRIFTTESAASWFFNPEGVPQSVSGLVDNAWIAPVKGNFIERAGHVASAIRASEIDVAFYHAGLGEQITARVAAFRPTAIQVNVAYGVEMDPSLFDGYIHLTMQGLRSTRHASEPHEWIPPVSDIADRVRACPSSLRQMMGLESAATVSATLGDLQHLSKPEYLQALSGLLGAFPNHYHLIAGSGDVKTMKTIRAYLHDEGSLSRVRFLGGTSDVASVLAVADVYLAPLIHADESLLLEAMGAGKACVVLGNGEDPRLNFCAELLGIPELTAAGDSEYMQIAQRLIRDKAERNRCAGLVQSRFDSHFASSLAGRRYIDFLDRIAPSQ
jgi:hypothetical protein